MSLDTHAAKRLAARNRLRALGFFACILAVMAFGGKLASAQVRVGWEETADLRSPHPYAAGSPSQPVVWQDIIRHADATYIAVHFAKFSLGPGDRLVLSSPDGSESYVFEGEGPGQSGPFWGTSIVGDTAVMTLLSEGGPGGYGVDIDGYSRGFSPMFPETICGSNNQRNAKCFESSNPDEYGKAKAVGRLLIYGSFLCTGSVVSCENHFLTNQHCVGNQSDVTNTEIRFMYETTSCSGGSESYGIVSRGNSFLGASVELDYCLMTVTNDPASTYGHNILTDRKPRLDERIFIAQHPGGVPKLIAIDDDMSPSGFCQVNDAERDGNGFGTDFGYYCDTEGGSSGSPVLSRDDFKMIGLHHFGTGSTPCRGVDMNAGVQMNRILQEIGGLLPPCATCSTPESPTNLAAQPGDNQVSLTWNHPIPPSTIFKVYRSETGCTGPWVHIGSSAVTSYTDNTASGGTTYAYTVTALTDCESPASNCVEATPTGNCTRLPIFNGAGTVAVESDPFCLVDLTWSGASPQCSPTATYAVYRDTDPAFVPGPGSLLAACLTATSYRDTSVQNATTYYYVVRAEDGTANGIGPCNSGNQDTNTVRRDAPVWGPLAPGVLTDGAESPTGLVMTPEGVWARSTALVHSGAYAYRAAGDVVSVCDSLRSPRLRIGPAGRLTFSTFMDALQDGQDGGIVEISVDAGMTWTKLNPDGGYPSTIGILSDSCVNPGFGGPRGAYTGTSTAWLDQSVDLSTWSGLEALLRFRFGTNSSFASTAWYVDDIGVTGVDVPGDCVTGTPPPGEVSGHANGLQLWVVKEGPGLRFYFESRADAAGYNLYQGTLGSWYSHGDTPFACNAPFTASALSGRLETLVSTGAGALSYFLVTAWNGDPVNGQEGTAGYDGLGAERPPDENTCEPVNNH